VSVIDVLTNTVIHTLNLPVPAVAIAFKPNGSRVYVGANDTFYTIDPASFTVLAKVPVGSYPVGIAITPTGTEAYVCNRNSIFVSRIDLKTNKLIENIQVNWGVDSASFLLAN
jgi:YVTN family beta-propeller protein